ncbi:hypothetical protein GCM10010169_52570 [Micromonospora fulviviridis]|nr:hypothetical protein GCM10010169_52570 [Micromonospora fulviviridis]
MGPVLAARRAALDEQRLSAVELRARLELELGRTRSAIACLTDHVVTHPYREQAHALLARARYADGDPAGALAAIRRAEAVLADQLGIKPGSELRRRPGTRARSYPADRLAAVTEPAQLTHVDPAGAARMVDVSAKPVSGRLAVAAGRLRTTAEVVELLRRDGLPKGDALAVGRLAGIMGAKRTPDLIPLCHPIALHGVTVDLRLTDDTVEITATARTADRTGVEMEALTAVAVAGLALVDMVKAVDPAASVDAVRVLRKEGGKTGEWVRPEDRP